MKRSILLLTLSALTLSSCNLEALLGLSSAEESEPSISFPAEQEKENEDDIVYDFSYRALVMKDDNGEKFKFNRKLIYNDSFFVTKGTTFNNGLALMSYPLIYSTLTKEAGTKFHSALGFSDITFSPDYDAPDSPETVKFNIAKKKIGDSYVVSVGLNGLNYKLPWVNNFRIGKTGDALGFGIGANKVLATLRNYISQINEPVKLWIAGYSRTAAVASVVARNILEENLVSEENMYCYAFEAPAAFDVTALSKHDSIHNVINSGDFVTYIPPKEFGLVRAGNEIDTYTPNLDEILYSYDRRLIIPKFSDPDEILQNDPGTCQYIVNELLKEGSAPSMSTREKFVENYQDDFCYIMSLIMTLSADTIQAIGKSAIKEGIALLVRDGLYKVVKTELDNAHVSYDDSALRSSCNKIVTYAINNGLSILLMCLIDDYYGDLTRTILLHSPELTFPLLAYKLSATN